MVLAAAVSVIACVDPARADGIASDETALFLPTYAVVRDGKATGILHSWIFELERDSALRGVLTKAIAEAADLDFATTAGSYFSERVRYFLVDNQEGKSLTVTLAGKRFDLAETKDNGHAITAFTLSSAEPGFFPFASEPRQAHGRIFHGIVFAIGPRGVSVISDIDDTIKISNVADKKALMRNVFTQPYQPVPGMAAVYGAWQDQGAVFHYVSGSPWQLFPPLAEFVTQQKFPPGTFHMKYFRLKDSSVIDFLSADQRTHKESVISKILTDFPDRHFILMGDSGEQDPEIYTAIARRFPDQIIGVYIHDVGGMVPGSARFVDFSTALDGIDFQIFHNGASLPASIVALTGQNK